MPKSKPRKPRPTRAGQTATPATPIEARAFVTRKATRSGHRFTRSQYHPVGTPVECWTNAWFYAREHRLRYAEGVVTMPNGLHLHAWCVAEDGTAIEVTRGYDVGTDYRGWILNQREIEHLTQAWTGPRSSALESGYASGVAPWGVLLARVAAPLETQPGQSGT